MASFCSNCGAPASGAFCVQCGNPVQTPASATPSPAPAAPVKAGGGSAAKIILIAGGVFVAFGLVAAGGLLYVGYRAKQKIVEIGKEYGVDIGSAAKSGRSAPSESTPATPAPSPSAGSGCPILSGQEAAQILGIAVERVESRRNADGSETCEFFVNVAERLRLAKEQMAKGIGQMQSAKDDKTGVQEAERLTTGALNALQNLAGADDAGPSFTLEFMRSGAKPKWANLEKAQGGVQGTTGFGMAPVEGLGDKAYLVPAGAGVFVLKGDAMLAFAFRAFAPGRDKATALARQASGRL
ncbi:MAG: zinc ribbon domain-containing protein [Acidobacteria bacterium]|nr:zinc ribbon domain-containing protein [Acidobacteriota bacterium]